jgi:hypothetical protein
VAKLQDVKIGRTELVEYLDTSSDFAFELRCLELLSNQGFSCKHGGSYTDAVTKKSRQFDIRAEKAHEKLRVRCAVECKNLKASFPLLVSCVPRSDDESFHDLVFAFDPKGVKRPTPLEAFGKNCQHVRVGPRESTYAVGAPVGKSCAQVGKGQDGSPVANDADVFDKWSQALASAADLADDAALEGEKTGQPCLSLVLPLVVVPDGTLWIVEYASNGSRESDPMPSERCSFFVGRDYAAGDLQWIRIVLSHIEFVTLSGLEKLASGILAEGNAWFPRSLFREPTA